MKERPILFTGPNVCSILDDSKTQTRRIMKPQPEPTPADYPGPSGHWWPSNAVQSMVHIEEEMQKWGGLAGDCCPHGDNGDGLWVRETFFAYGRWVTQYSEKKGRDEWHFVDMTAECDRAYQYAASNPDVPFAMFRDSVTPQWWKRPAIFMPRAASRILLEITGVRVERLQDISDQDAIAEGIGLNASAAGVPLTSSDETIPRAMYREMWESINGSGSWDINPWIWCVIFRRVQP